MLHRSYSLVPASDAAASREALAGAADLVVLDLEDMVAQADKPRARIMLRTGLSADWAGDERCAVRLNPWHSKASEVDRTALAGLYLPAVVVPKVDSPEVITAVRDAFQDPDLGAPAVHALIETPQAVEQVAALATAGVASLVFGAFDLAKVLDIAPDPDSATILEARTRIAEAATAAAVPCYDMPWVDTDDADGFEAHAARSLDLGFTGCCAITDTQARHINKVFPGKPSRG